MDKGIPVIVVLSKFFNGFQNGYIFRENWKTNIEDVDVTQYDPEYLLEIWKLGLIAGIQHRESRNS